MRQRGGGLALDLQENEQEHRQIYLRNLIDQMTEWEHLLKMKAYANPFSDDLWEMSQEIGAAIELLMMEENL
jgi:hypothetical protein